MMTGYFRPVSSAYQYFCKDWFLVWEAGMFTLLAELGIVAVRQIAELFYFFKAGKPWGDYPEKGIVRGAFHVEWTK